MKMETVVFFAQGLTKKKYRGYKFKMEKRTVVITGGNSGLGYQCAKNIALKSKNYTVVLACRNKNKAVAASESLRNETGNPNIYSLELDLASLASVREFHNSFKQENYPPLFSLVCNAGFNLPALAYTKDGFEATFGVCHLGHYLLANLMLPQMMNNGRIIFVSSDMHNPPKVIYPTTPAFKNSMELAYPEKNGKITTKSLMMRYPMAKLSNILCTREMASRIGNETKKHVTVNAFNPGLMTDTNFMSPNISKILRPIIAGFATLLSYVINQHGSSTESGKHLAGLVTEQQYEGATGKYYFRGKEEKTSKPAQDKAAAKKLWIESAELVQLKQDETILSRK
ncbi:SDR family NAD(P)-dependent oxidoreductase [Paenibacillus illinoisensis]|uniref:SDR family NAD(P)-dependent oxidoreductase n=2 Tax=Paenibacillus illinoisensis TaxID=59845 RepID=UPI003D9935E9